MDKTQASESSIDDRLPLLKEAAPAEPRKDIWDKFSALSGIASGVVVALIGFYATMIYDRRSREADQQDRARGVVAVELQTVERFFPHLMSKDETEKQAAIQAISSLANPELAAKLARVFGGTGARAALANIAVAVPAARPTLEVALTDLFKTFQPSLVLIRVDSLNASPRAAHEEGTGFLISGSSYLLTAASLFISQPGKPLRITVSQPAAETGSRDAQLVGLDETTGLALLRVTEALAAPALKLSHDQVHPADKVSVLGFQSAQDLSVSVSLIVSKSADMLSLELSAPPTMVGAPIIDDTGEVTGVLVQAGGARSAGVAARGVTKFLASFRQLE